MQKNGEVFGAPNINMKFDLDLMIAEMNKTNGGNNSSVGLNGEMLLIDKLNIYLPSQFRACKGHYIRIDGALSPEYDVLVVDSRFPIMNRTSSNIYTVCQHAVLCVIEVKRTVGKDEIQTTRNAILKLEGDIAQKPPLEELDQTFWSVPQSLIFAYRSEATLRTLAGYYYQSPYIHSDLYIMQHMFNCGNVQKGAGALIRIESSAAGQECMMIRCGNPLSDFYYMLIEKLYETTLERDLPDSNIRNVVSSYYSWSNFKESYRRL